MIINEQTLPTIKALEGLLLGSIKQSLKSKGHVATGKGLRSLESKVQEQSGSIVFQILGEEYLKYQDTGRKPGSMPPITPLIQWVRKKGIESDMNKAKGVAFAIAKNMMKIGMHSKNGRLDLSQRNFLTEGGEQASEVIFEKMFDVFETNFNTLVDDFAKGFEKER